MCATSSTVVTDALWVRTREPRFLDAGAFCQLRLGLSRRWRPHIGWPLYRVEPDPGVGNVMGVQMSESGGFQ